MMADLPERGEIWLVRFDPSVGDEIRKERPAVVLSSTRLIRSRARPASATPKVLKAATR